MNTISDLYGKKGTIAKENNAFKQYLHFENFFDLVSVHFYQLNNPLLTHVNFSFYKTMQIFSIIIVHKFFLLFPQFLKFTYIMHIRELSLSLYCAPCATTFCHNKNQVCRIMLLTTQNHLTRLFPHLYTSEVNLYAKFNLLQEKNGIFYDYLYSRFIFTMLLPVIFKNFYYVRVRQITESFYSFYVQI